MVSRQLSKGLLLTRQLLQTCTLVRQSAARATEAAEELDSQLVLFSTAASSNAGNVGPLPASVTSCSDQGSVTSAEDSLTSILNPASRFPFRNLPAKGFSTQAGSETESPLRKKQSYERQVKEVRKQYIEELAEKRRRDAAFEQRKKEILAARKQQAIEARLAAIKAGAAEKERLLQEERQKREVRRQEGRERLRRIQAVLQEKRDQERAVIVGSSKGWVKEEELEDRIELALDTPFSL